MHYGGLPAQLVLRSALSVSPEKNLERSQKYSELSAALSCEDAKVADRARATDPHSGPEGQVAEPMSMVARSRSAQQPGSFRKTRIHGSV